MKTNDLEKMRQEYEEKLRYAEMENELNARAGFDWGYISIIGESITQPGKLHTAIRLNGYGREGLTAAQAAEVLNTFPQTERARTYTGDRQYTELSYIMNVHRTPGQYATILSIEYISGDLDLSLEMAINPQDDDTMQFFRQTSRVLTDTEVNIYLHSRTRWNYNTRNNFTYYTFNLGRVVKFQGGHDKQTDEGAAIAIASNLWCRTSE